MKDVSNIWKGMLRNLLNNYTIYSFNLDLNALILYKYFFLTMENFNQLLTNNL